MARDTQQFVPIPIPRGGLDENSSFSELKPNVSAACLNVRPKDCRAGRDRVSRRPAMRKVMSNSLGSGSVQNLSVTQVAIDETAGTGDVLSIAGASGSLKARVYSYSAGGTQMTSASALVSAQTLGCVDENNNFYVAAVAASQIEVRKIAADYTESWAKIITGPASNSLMGIAAFGRVVYVFIMPANTSVLSTHGIYRFDADTGAQLDSSPWLTNATDSLATIVSQTKAYQNICIGGGILAVVGSDGTNLVLQQWNLQTKTLSHSTAIQSALAHYPCKVVTDAGANFYVLTEAAAAAANKIYKVTWSGEIPTGWPITPGGTGRDICYDPIGFQIALTGSGLGGGTNSVQVFNATTGLKTAGGQPGSVASWHAISADGLSTIVAGNSVGGFRLRRTVAAGSVDIISVVAPTAVTADPAASWSVTSNLDTFTTQTLWVVCSGLSVIPTRTSMDSTRITRSLGIAGGSLYSFDIVNNVRTLITANFMSGSAPTIYSALGRSAPTSRGLTLYYVDGSKYGTYNISTGQTGTWVATQGTLPQDPNGGKCRLITSWRGRLPMAGLLSDPQNAFSPAQDDPTNFLYNPANYVSTEAWALSLFPCGRCPDIINCMIPYNDDTMIFGCAHSLWMMSGDPAAGGRFDNINTTIGMAFGTPWCIDPNGVLYFFSNRGAIYRMMPGQKPDRISDNIDSSRLFNVNLSQNRVQMAWDDRWKWLHVVISPIDPNADATHYVWDSKSDQWSMPHGSWWPENFANRNMNSLAICVADGDRPGERIILWGGRDGVIRAYDNDGKSDDGTAINSYIDIGPITGKGTDLLVNDLRFILGDESGACEYSVRAGESVQAAFEADIPDTDDLISGRNLSQATRSRGRANYVRIGSQEKDYLWTVESLHAMLTPLSPIASRRF